MLGIVLDTLPFRDKDLIVTLLTAEGLVKFFYRRRQIISPLIEGEFLLTKGRGDLYRFSDMTILDQHTRLRERLENLEAAGLMIRAVLRSQDPDRECPGIFLLFRKLLNELPESKDPMQLAHLFLLKVLIHEGLLQLDEQCSMCKTPPTYRFGGERFCATHAPRGALELTQDEEKSLVHLAKLRSLKEMASAPYITTLFDHAFA